MRDSIWLWLALLFGVVACGEDDAPEFARSHNAATAVDADDDGNSDELDDLAPRELPQSNVNRDQPADNNTDDGDGDNFDDDAGTP